MSLIPTIYSSTDPGAPQLSGTVGSLISVLRAVLVTGYGTAPNAKAGAGWTEEFTGANVVAFRNSPVTGTGYRLRVLDDGSAAAGGGPRSATLRGYESMSDVDTGLNPVPTAAQLANGLLWVKSTTADTGNRGWFAFANERWVYLFVDVNGISTYEPVPYFVGDLNSAKAGDNHCFVVSGTDDTSYAGNTSDFQRSRLFGFQSKGSSNGWWGSAVSAAIGCGYVARAQDQVIGATPIICDAPSNAGSTSAVYGSSENKGENYPSVINNGLLYEEALVRETGFIRGVLPGVFVPLHPGGMTDSVMLTDVQDMPAGTDFMFKAFVANARSAPGYVLLNLASDR